VELAPPAPVRVGDQLYTTRPGAERDLLEEIFYSDARVEPRHAGPSLVATRGRPMTAHRQSIELAFARQGFPVAAVLRDATPDAVAREVRAALVRAGRPQAFAFDAWVPDADQTNPLAQSAASLAEAVKARLASDREWGPHLVADARDAFHENGLYAQACVLPDGVVAVGATPARDAPSLASGGRMRVHVPESAPSRAAMKLVEALTWLDRGPEPGDLCVDLGAAPGGWTWVLLERRARVLAIDPGDLAPNLRKAKGLVHLRADAFRVEPEESMDWLFCDMAFRPLEAAGLLAKWARRKWARLLVANIKLPMKQKAQYLFRVRDILEDGGWSHLRVRQLYHDRDEVTFAAVRLT
jgi:23S rRNA (cytidine2498-2'-O)-methyltransferase